MNGVWIALGIVAGAAVLVVLVVVAVLLRLRYTLLSNIATVDIDEVDPALRKEIERLSLEYAVAEDLGYPGEVLVHLEAQLNALKLAASGDPNANLTIFVVAPAVDPAVLPSLAVLRSEFFGAITMPEFFYTQVIASPRPVAPQS